MFAVVAHISYLIYTNGLADNVSSSMGIRLRRAHAASVPWSGGMDVSPGTLPLAGDIEPQEAECASVVAGLVGAAGAPDGVFKSAPTALSSVPKTRHFLHHECSVSQAPQHDTTTTCFYFVKIIGTLGVSKYTSAYQLQ
jgi:hypothetical protein